MNKDLGVGLFIEIGRSSSLTEGIWLEAKRTSQAWGKGLALLRSFLTFTGVLCTSDWKGMQTVK